ncbi:4-(cytidine 5'-diphospho)-2-C-methyl-D-erythritol kinase [uncultured Algimonas sp.]|uniref:4-(cytidine 5'-diphospho)-2-C-methyl-D-erythritol kinase n=1 Tax=uncultured Algimonas sp. TaxID=1547920 RepID=UPI0026218123|nr:4-(cytidine 5'-diphospho)-2-C-methyl-D-erythritol kinase [uncultured Algimonas sp.]
MFCGAKVNLTLHVGAPIRKGRWRGYHPVDSLVVFADVGDHIAAQPATETSLTIDGPFSQELSVGPDNLILKAMRMCDAPPHALVLTKTLPVAAGIGGGSANAAAILRRFDPDGEVDATSLGADVPVCRLSRTAMMEGIGERITPLPGLERVAAVLVNPGVPVPTSRIFANYDATGPAEVPERTVRAGTLLDRARAGRNDLQETACAVAPVIGEVIAALQSRPGCRLARMSGSGATCFGLFDDKPSADAAAAMLARTGWWVAPTWLGDDDRCR